MSKLILSHFFHGKFQRRWRDVKTGRFVRKIKVRMFRVTVGLNGLVKTHVYRNFTCYRIVSEDEIEDAEVECREDVIRQATQWLGYSEDLWWTEPVFGEEVLEVEM